MYAIIETGGKHYWVSPGEKIQIEKLEAEKGKELTFNALWAADDSSQSTQKAKVTAEVLRGFRAPKIIVFKRRQKKAYKRLHGHRQNLTEILIKSISFN